MNKIYKVIWNKVRNCYVVVSEITKARSKGGSTVRRVPRMEAVLTAMLLASVLSLEISAPVWAESSTGAKYYGVNYSAGETGNLNGEGASGTHSIAAGVNAKATGENAISIGFSANNKTITVDDISMIPTVIMNSTIHQVDDTGSIISPKSYYSAGDWLKLSDEKKIKALVAEMNYRLQNSGGADSSIAIGDKTFSLKGDVVVGSNALAMGNYAVVIGRGTTGSDNSVALGSLASAAQNSIAIGAAVAGDTSKPAAQATANYSIAIGNQAEATQSNALALGIGAKASTNNAIAIGLNANNTNNDFNSILLPEIGYTNTSNNTIVREFGSDGKPTGKYYTREQWRNFDDNTKKAYLGLELNQRLKDRDIAANSNTYRSSISIGESTNALKEQAVSIGSTSIAAGSRSIAVGRKARAIANDSISIGTESLTGAFYATAIGDLSKALGDRSNALGYSATAQGSDSTAIGKSAQTSTSGSDSTAIGTSANAQGKNSNAFGKSALTLGNDSTAIGSSANAQASNSNAIGKGAQTSGDSSTAIGNTAIATGPSALALGTSAKAENQDAIAIGRATASDMNSIAIGSRTRDTYYTQASGNNSIAIGLGTQTFKANTVALGNGAKSYGYQSSTVGFHSYSFGDESTVFGHDSTAHGRASSAFGYLSTAGAVTLLKGDKDQNYQDAWSRIRVVKAETDTEGNIIYTRLGNKSAGTGDDGPNEYEIVTTASGQVVALKRDTAERAQNADGKVPPDYYKITELRTVSNLKSETGTEIKNHQGYWFVVDTSDDGKIDNIDDINTYGGQTEGGVAVGDYANAVGNKSLAVGRSTVADGNNSAAIGMFANAYGTGGMAYGQHTSTGLVSQITLDKDQYITNLKKPTADSGAVNSQSVAVYRRLVNGNTAFLNKLNEYVLSDGKDSEGNKVPVKMNAKGEVVAYWKGAIPTDDTEYLNPDKWTSVTTPISVKGKDGKIHTVQKDASSNRYYYGRNTYISDTDEVTLSLEGKTVTLQAGNLMLTEGGVAMGAYAHAEGEQSLALGRVAGAYDKNSTAVGQFANALGEDSVVIGHNASAGAVVEVKDQKTNMATVVLENGSPKSSSGTGGIAMGSYSHAVGKEATAIGSRNIVTGENSIAIGTGHTVNGNNSGAFGDPNVVNADSSYVFGNSSKIEDANITDAFILGNNASVTKTGGVALGSKSAATTGLSKGGYNASTGSKEYTDGTSVWQSTDAAVSVGKADGSVTRQITNVAAGSEDTDAVNVAQLKKVAASAGGSLNFGGDNTTETANIITVNSGEQLNVKGGIKDESKLTDDNIGVIAENTTNTLTVKLSNKIKLNDGGHLKIGETTDTNGQTVVDQYGITLYPSTSASGSVSTRFTRNGISAGNQKIENVADGTGPKDAVNVSQLKTAKTEVTAGTNVEVIPDTDKTDGHMIYKVNLADNINLTSAGSLAIGNATGSGQTLLDQNGLTIYPSTSSTDPAVAKFTKSGISAGNQKIENVAEGVADTDAVNVSQLEKAKKEAVSSVKLKFEGESGETLERGNDETLRIVGDGTNITTKTDKKNNEIKVELSKNLNVESVTAGDTVIKSDGVTAKSLIAGDTTINTNGLAVAGGPTVTKTNVDMGGQQIHNVKAGTAGTDAVNLDQLNAATSGSRTEVKAGTNISSVEHETAADGHSIYTVNADGASVSAGSDAVKVTKGEKDVKNITEYAVDLSDKTKATLDKVEKEGLVFAGDTGASDKIKLGEKLNLKGGATGTLSDGNIGVEADGDTLNIKLAKEIKDVDSITVNNRIKVGDSTTIGDDTITTRTVNADTVKAGGTTIDDNGITTDDGKGPSVTKDGIDAGKKKITKVAPGEAPDDAVNFSQLKEASGDIYNDLNRLDDRTRKGLAGAAALAALHPMDFNPDDKMQFSAGVGHYRGENAAAIGAFYRPDENVMFSIGGVIGNGDNMLNAGITFGLDGTRNRITRTRTAMAHEIVELKQHIARQDEQIARQDEQIAKLTELVNKLVGPEQQIENTATFPDVPERELEPEQSRIYVERISGQDNDRKKAERVRVNNSDSKYPEGKTRDVYGGKTVSKAPGKAAAK